MESAMRANLDTTITSNALVIIEIKPLIATADRMGGTEFPAFPAHLAKAVITDGPLQEEPSDKAVHDRGTRHRGSHFGKLEIPYPEQVAFYLQRIVKNAQFPCHFQGRKQVHLQTQHPADRGVHGKSVPACYDYVKPAGSASFTRAFTLHLAA